MKVQDVKKECLTTVGLSIEFSNSEVSTLSHLLTVVSNAVEKGIEQARGLAKHAERKYGDNEDVPCAIDLKSLKRVEWLLTQLTRRDMSGLFEMADADYRTELSYINDIPAAKADNTPATTQI